MANKLDRRPKKGLPHYAVRRFLGSRRTGPKADARVAELLGLPQGPPYTTDVRAIIAELQKAHAWWSLSHIRAQVAPTTPAPGLEGLVSNAARYTKDGKAVFYDAMFAGDNPAWSLCESWIKAQYDLPPAFFVEASLMEKVLAERVETRRERMAYYRAREARRQEAIKRWEREHRPARP